MFQIFMLWEVFFICLLIIQKVKSTNTRVRWPRFKTRLPGVPATVLVMLPALSVLVSLYNHEEPHGIAARIKINNINVVFGIVMAQGGHSAQVFAALIQSLPAFSSPDSAQESVSYPIMYLPQLVKLPFTDGRIQQVHWHQPTFFKASKQQFQSWLTSVSVNTKPSVAAAQILPGTDRHYSTGILLIPHATCLSPPALGIPCSHWGLLWVRSAPPCAYWLPLQQTCKHMGVPLACAHLPGHCAALAAAVGPGCLGGLWKVPRGLKKCRGGRVKIPFDQWKWKTGDQVFSASCLEG